MERSLAARVVRPLGLPSLRIGSFPSRGAGALADWLRRGFSFIWEGRRSRIALIAVLVALPVLGGGFLLLRNSSFVAVRHVRISGVRGAEAKAIEGALVTAAKQMSTLNVHVGALQAAVAPFRVVSAIRVESSLPHSLRIYISEEPPVATLVVSGARTAVAANGVVLGPALVSSSLPTINGYFEPAAGQRLHDGSLLELLEVLGAAPSALRRHVAKVYNSSEGLTMAMSDGLLVYFGDATRPHAKWLSLARVLADHSSVGASYVDVRLPARPAAGFPAGMGPSSAGSESSGEESATAEPVTGGSQSAVGSLAAGLAKESGTSASSPATSSEPSPSGSTSTESSSEGSSESSSSESSERPSSSGSEATQEAPTAGG